LALCCQPWLIFQVWINHQQHLQAQPKSRLPTPPKPACYKRYSTRMLE
jgi:hypothetical protein